LVINYVFSSLSFPPKEGLHNQAVALIEAMVNIGHRVRVFAIVKNIALFDVERFSDLIGGTNDIVLFESSDRYPKLLVKNIFPRFFNKKLFLSFQEFSSRAPKNSIWHIEGLPLHPLLDHHNYDRAIASSVDAWALRQFRLSRHDDFFQKINRLIYAAISIFVEITYFNRYSAVHFVSKADEIFVKRYVPDANLFTIPVAFSSSGGCTANLTNRNSRSYDYDILFWGDISVPHIRDGLIWFAKSVYPKILNSFPSVKFAILARNKVSKDIVDLLPGCIFFEWVDDVDKLILSTKLIILPDIDGTGLKNRVVHAMSVGGLVVGSVAAFEGIDVINGRDAFVVNGEDQFLSAVQYVLSVDDFSVFEEMRARAASFVYNKYSSNTVYGNWDRVYSGFNRI
jgi:hypothetical protein